MDSPVVRDAALALLRIVFGVVFIAHGWDQLVATGIVETTGQFSAVHVPQPQLSAWIASLVQLVAGGMLVLGFLTTIAASALALLMAAAFYFVHLSHGLFINQGGFEYVLVLFTGMVLVIVFGPGRASVDGYLAR